MSRMFFLNALPRLLAMKATMNGVKAKEYLR